VLKSSEQPSLLLSRQGSLVTFEPETSLGAGATDEFEEHAETEEHDERECAEAERRRGVASGRLQKVEVPSTAGLGPLLVARDGRALDPVDELGQGDISVVLEDVYGLEVAGSSVLELDPQEVPGVGGRATAELEGERRSVVGNSLELGVGLDDVSLVEQGNERLVGGLHQHELKGVAIEGNTLQRVDDGVEDGATSNVSRAIDFRVGEDSVFVEVNKTAGLLNEGRRETVRVGLVVGQLRVHEIVNIPDVLEGSSAPEDIVPDSTEEGLSIPSDLFELGRVVEICDVLLEVRAVGPALQGAVIAGLHGLDRDILVTAKRGGDNSRVGEGDPVLRGGGEQSLQKGNSGVEHNGALSTSLDANLDLRVVNKVGADTLDERRGAAIEVGRPQESTELVRLNLAERSGLSGGSVVVLGILVVLLTVTVASNNNNTEELRHLLRGGSVVRMAHEEDVLKLKIWGRRDG
jgi:hypothetical protein